ncbi:MAG: MFS transporter [Hyphomicrobiales bacterium]|nr:MAG: MFS transporter [Hyphomicrobiales bacterium]
MKFKVGATTARAFGRRIGFVPMREDIMANTTDITDASLPTATVTTPQHKRRVYGAAAVGTAVEYYDFNIYGTAAALVFSQVFFAQVDGALGLVLSFTTLAVGYAARPIGGILGGHFGDRIGRKAVLIATMTAMGVSTFGIGILPSSAAIGSSAAVLLIILRLIQGLAAGGEYGGAVTLAAEHSERQQRGLMASSASIGVYLGAFLAWASFAALGFMSDESFEAWGWRLPFLGSIVLVAVGLYVRLRVDETPHFKALKAARAEQTPTERRSRRDLPIISVIRDSPKKLLLATILYTGPSLAVALTFIFILSYATNELGAPRTLYVNSLMLSMGLGVLIVPLVAALSDRIGRRWMFIAATIGAGVWSFIIFPLAENGSTWAVLGIFLVGVTLLNSVTLALSSAILAEAFPTKHRYTGVSVAFQFAGFFGFGLGPLMAALIVAQGWGTLPISSIVLTVCVASAICTFALGKTHEEELDKVG